MSPLPDDDAPAAGPPAGARLPDHGSGNALPKGTMLGEFELLAVAGEGGFAIVYRAWDHSLKRQVALKEYLPATLAMRHSGLQVLVKPGRQGEAFWKGLESFVMEAQLLARFDHPALVKVFRFWEANGTAYMVMPFYEGRTLRDELAARAEPPDEATLLGWLGPVADALAVIHAEHWYHRDVAPDNVLLLANSGRPLLLDFGAARQVIGDMTQALTVILKPGYAPIEQYTDIPGVHQGPWTDVYALAAVAHFAICGKTPPPSVGRMLTDSFQPLARLAAGRYSPRLLQALDSALSVRPDGRPQSIAEFKQAIGLDSLPPMQAMHPASATSLPGQQVRLRSGPTPQPSGPSGPSGPSSPAAPAHHAAELMHAPPLPPPPPLAAAPADADVANDAATDAATEQADRLRAQRRRMLLTGGLIALAMMGLGGVRWVYRNVISPQPAPHTATAGLASAPSAQPEPPALSPPAAAAGPAPTPAPTPAPAPTAAPAHWDLDTEFARVQQAQSAGWGLDVTLDKPDWRINRDRLVFTLRSLQDGYVYVFQHGTQGELQQLYPNALNPPPRVSKGHTLRLPQGSLEFNVDGPAGPSELLVLVSRWPRQHRDAQPRDEAGFLVFATDAAAAARAAAAPPGQPLLAGRPVCSPAGSACSDAFGAARVAFKVVP